MAWLAEGRKQEPGVYKPAMEILFLAHVARRQQRRVFKNSSGLSVAAYNLSSREPEAKEF